MKSLELNWIRRKCDKSIPIPEVVYYPLDDASGVYYHPQNYELYDIDGHPHWMRYGVIVVNTDCPLPQATIAHEWRHHWQYYHGIEFEKSSRVDTENYNESLLNYFTDSKTERDALRFEYKYVGTTYPEWEKPLYSILKDLMVHPLITYGNTTSNKQKVYTHSPNCGYSYKTHKKARRV